MHFDVLSKPRRVVISHSFSIAECWKFRKSDLLCCTCFTERQMFGSQSKALRAAQSYGSWEHQATPVLIEKAFLLLRDDTDDLQNLPFCTKRAPAWRSSRSRTPLRIRTGVCSGLVDLDTILKRTLGTVKHLSAMPLPRFLMRLNLPRDG